VLYRHLTHQQYTLAAIDGIILCGRQQDWSQLRRSASAESAVLEKILYICQTHVADPYVQRYHFWEAYAERYPA
jgi:hypothetical protein